MDERCRESSCEVLYALPDRPLRVAVRVESGMTVIDAVERSGLLATTPGPDRDRLVLAVFGRRVSPDTPAEPGQRIEICRPLIADPRDSRRLAAEQGGVMGGTPTRGDR